MLKATAGKLLPMTIQRATTLLSWGDTENLGTRSFLDAMVTTRFANSTSTPFRLSAGPGGGRFGYRDRRRLPVDRCGRAELDEPSTPPHGGVRDAAPRRRRPGPVALRFARHILHDYLKRA
jgi:hypothetical protein